MVFRLRAQRCTLQIRACFDWGQVLSRRECFCPARDLYRNNSIVGARAVVTKDVGPDSVVAGTPAKEIDKTSRRTKVLSDVEKEGTVREIIDHFMKIYPGRTKLLQAWDNIGYIVSYSGQPICYRTRIDDTGDPFRFYQILGKSVYVDLLWHSS